MISDKDKLSLITRITDDVVNYPPGDGDEVGYYSASLNCISLIASYGEEENAGN